MFSLKGKTTLVTGAGSGIGEAIAHTFAGAGAFVYVADRDAQAASRVAEVLTAEGFLAVPLTLDVAVEADVAAAVRVVMQSRGGLDVLVNNAGVGHVGTLAQTTGEDLDRLYRVNVRGVFNMTKACLEMLLAGRGAIVNVASIGGILGIRDRLAYCTSKFAVVGFTKAMALDHAAAGLRVNCVCPGRVETPFVTARLKEYPDPEAAYREMASTQALGRMGRPEEVAAAVLYLASDEAGFMTGTALLLDGGWSAGK